LSRIPEFVSARFAHGISPFRRACGAAKKPEFSCHDGNFSKCRISDFETKNKFFEKQETSQMREVWKEMFDRRSGDFQIAAGQCSPVLAHIPLHVYGGGVNLPR